MDNFADRLIAACQEKDSIVCVGIDPRPDLLPAAKDRASTPKDRFVEFGHSVIDAVKDVAVAVKPQSAFFELLGPPGVEAYWQIADYAGKQGLLVIADVKRSDIGSTADAYARAYLGGSAVWSRTVDAVTVNPYLGSDGILPFVKLAKDHAGGVFVLVKTSNPSSGELQDLVADGKPVYEHVAGWLADHADDLMGESGYSSLGAVVGATYPEQLARLRKLMPNNLFLIPGYGAQGGGATDVKPGLDADGLGAIVNASRSVIFAYRDETWAAANDPADWTDAVRDAASRMRDELNEVRR
ncbi:MAG TPA: orotidine-5'-phosphate decarboxylase [Planctomycetota bacterium]|nr:orotidine-5'-phosphate decarboxylase [Planctomycetota bacterium]